MPGEKETRPRDGNPDQAGPTLLTSQGKYTSQSADTQELQDATPSAAETRFFFDPTNLDAAEILADKLTGILFEYEPGRWWSNGDGGPFQIETAPLTKAGRILRESAQSTLHYYEAEASPAELPRLHEKAAKAIRKAQATDFQSQSMRLLSELASEINIAWNHSPYTLPCADGKIDFSGNSMMALDYSDSDRFNTCIPEKTAVVLEGGSTKTFDRVMAGLFPDAETRESALFFIASILTGKGAKLFTVLYSSHGNGGKGFFVDLIFLLLPQGQGVMLSPDLISSKGNESVERFEKILLRGSLFGVIDEHTDALAIAKIKRLLSLGLIRGEKKGADPVEFPQTWLLAVMTNELPSFRPADDNAFHNRLVVLTFQSGFYEDETQAERMRKRGLPEDRLHPAEDKGELLAQLKRERPAVLHKVIQYAIRLREEHKGRLPESSLMRQEKEIYRSENDLVESFITEYIQLTPFAQTYNEDLLAAYREFSGDDKAKSTWLIRELKKRVPGIESGHAGAKRYQKGVVLKESSDEPEDSPEFGTVGTVEGKFTPRERKNENPAPGGEKGDNCPKRPGESERMEIW